MTLAELKERIFEEDAAGAFTAADVTHALNEALRVFVLLTLCVERTARLRLDPDVRSFHMLDHAGDFLLPLRVKLQTLNPGISVWDRPLWDSVLWDEYDPSDLITDTVLRPARLHELDALDRSWRIADGTATRYAVAGFDLLLFDRTPSESGSWALVTYAAAPSALQNDADVPEIPAEYHPALLDWAIPALRLNDGGRELQQSLPLLDRFLTATKKMNTFVRARYQALSYDRLPFELASYDLSALLNIVKEKQQQRKKAA